MNVELNYKKSLFRFDVEETRPISYIEEIAGKVFNLFKEKICLFFNDQQIMNTNLLLRDYFIHEDKITLKVEGLENLCQSTIHQIQNTSEKSQWDGVFNKKISYFNPKRSSKEKDRDRDSNNNQMKTKTTAIQSQDSQSNFQCSICKKRESVFYCRECNVFFCSSCQEGQTYHDDHKILRIEKGNVRQSTLMYKRDLINEIKKAEKDLQDSSAYDIDDALIANEANDVILTIKKIIAKRDDIAILIPSSTIKEYRLELLMTKIYSQFPNDDFFNESMESIFKMMNSHEKELRNIQEEIRRIKIKSEFRQMIFAVIHNVNKILDKTFNDVNSIYQNSMGKNSNIIVDIQNFLNKTSDRFPMEPMSSHTRFNSYNNYNHIALPGILDTKSQIQNNDLRSYNVDANNGINTIITSKNNILNSRDPKFNFSLRNRESYKSESTTSLMPNIKMNGVNTPTKVFPNVTFRNKMNSQVRNRDQHLQLKQQEIQTIQERHDGLVFNGGVSKSLILTEPNAGVNDRYSNNNTINNQSYFHGRQQSKKKTIIGLINSVKADPGRLIQKKKKKAKLDLI